MLVEVKGLGANRGLVKEKGLGLEKEFEIL